MMTKIKIVSLNSSSKKGVVKNPVTSATLNELGMVGDAHAGHWHRQVSLLGIESYRRMEAKGENVKLDLGVFAENITTEGFELFESNILDRFVNNNFELEVTQIGKKCHHGCEIMQKIGDCVMPREGIFARVIKGGELNVGETFEYKPRVFKILVLTFSDRAYKGVYEDKSGPLTGKLLSDFFDSYGRKHQIEYKIVPDDEAIITEVMAKAKTQNFDIIISTGGTGLGKRDIAPEVMRPFFDKEIPGIMEHIRLKYGASKPNALISRSIAGVMDETLIYVIPGSTKAVKEYIDEIVKTIEHSVRMITGVDNH